MSQASRNLLLSSLTSFYQRHPSHRKTLYEIVEGISPLSLRVIDWFVTHYARVHPIIYWIDDGNGKMYETYPENGGSHLRKFSLYLDYRAQLKSYTKMFMDCFRRHERITFVLETNPLTTIETTVGQLNFCRWFLSQHVYEYIRNHLTEIEKSMCQYQKNNKATTTATPTPENQPHIQMLGGAPPVNTVLRARCHVRFD